MHTVMIPKFSRNHDAVDWAKENCPSLIDINTRVIRSTNEYVFLFKFERPEDAVLFSMRWV